MDNAFDFHLNCSSGLAGDMFLGACLDLGLPLELLTRSVEELGLHGVTVQARRAKRGGVGGLRFRVLVGGRPVEGPDPEEAVADATRRTSDAHVHPPADTPRDLAGIRNLLTTSRLDAAVRERAVELFVRLGEAEAKVHQVPLERVHFHEVGAVDSIVDLVGAAVAVEWLRPRRLTCGPVLLGGGTVSTQHGVLPVPAPATAELLRGIPVEGCPGGELLTPTGAVLLAELVDSFQELPAMVVERIGYGLGRREVPGRANAVRLLQGRGQDEPEATVMVVESEIDDLTGEGFGFLLERLLDCGALDVYYTPVQMKKNRPGTLVTFLCRPPQLEELCGLLLAESGALGCRYFPAARFEAEREWTPVTTPYGSVRVKRARFQGRAIADAPEFEDCRRLALEQEVPWREVYRAALAAVARGE